MPALKSQISLPKTNFPESHQKKKYVHSSVSTSPMSATIPDQLLLLNEKIMHYLALKSRPVLLSEKRVSNLFWIGFPEEISCCFKG